MAQALLATRTSALGKHPKNTPKTPKKNPRNSKPTGDADKQTKYWAFTCNNPLSQITALPTGCTYLISGKEVGADGTPHLQGYVELTRHQRRAYVVKLLPGCHVMPRYEHSTAEQAATYCKKDGDYVEFGTISPPPKPGTRSDLNNMAKLVEDGATLEECYVASPTTYMRNYRAIQHARQVTHKPLAFRPNLQIRLYIGKTRTGKSYHARITEDCFAKPVGKGLWFDGYDRHKRVVIDEYRGQFPLSDVLQITDPFKVQVETKGSHTWFEPDLVIFTTNDHPADMYTDHNEETREAFFARFNEVWWWYAPRKYMILSDEQKDVFFHEKKYPSVPIDCTMIVKPAVLDGSGVHQKPRARPTLKRQNAMADLTEVSDPKYTFDHKTKTVERAAKKPRLDFEKLRASPLRIEIPDSDEEGNISTVDEFEEDLQTQYEEAHARPNGWSDTGSFATETDEDEPYDTSVDDVSTIEDTCASDHDSWLSD